MHTYQVLLILRVLMDLRKLS